MMQMSSDLLSGEEQSLLARRGFTGRVGMGRRAALIVVDAQNYMVGPPKGSTDNYPSACGLVAQNALKRLVPLIGCARACAIPVIYSRLQLRRDGSDMGVYRRKRDVSATDTWCWEGTHGADIVDTIEPSNHDVVLVKKKFSVFFGTPLLSILIDRRVDTVVITGGSTSNCVRATAVDSASYNFRTIVVADCVFDRVDISHRVALMDLDRQYADVMESDAIMAMWTRNASEEKTVAELDCN
jgi:maleamate amidohydrolase